MATSDRRHLINVHSSKIDKVPGVDTNDMRYGELAVNHFKGKAFISTRVSDTEMELFPSVHYIEQYPFSSLTVNGLTTLSGTTKIEKIEAGDNTFDKALDSNSTNAVQNKVITKTIEDNEKIVSSALNDLNDRKLDASAYTPTDLSDYYKKEETSGKTDIDTALSLKANASDLTTHTSDSTIHITGDERTKWDNAATNSHTHANKSILDSINGIDTELSETSNNLVVNSAITKVIEDNEKISSAALNDLNERIRGLSGKTVTTVVGDDSIIVNSTTNTDGTVNINLSASYDDHLDTGSTKAVQNKAIAQKLEELNEKITVSSGKGITGITGDDSITASTITNTDGTKQINLSVSYDTELNTTSTKAVQNKVITEAIQNVSSSLNEKADYSGITGDEAISVTASSSKDIKIAHKKGVQINQAGVDGTNGDITVNQTDKFGHIIASRPATAADIKKIGIALEGLTIKYGETKPVDNDLPGDFDRTEKVYDGKTSMTLVVPQKITDLEGGNDLAYVHLSGDTMTGDLTMSGANSSNNIVFSTSGLSGNSTVDIKAADAQLSMTSNGVSINKNIAITGTVTATDSIFSSDIRLKNNIGSICPCKFDNISKIILKEFTFNDDKKQRLRYGVIAQDLQNAGLDNLVVEGDDGYLGVDYISFLILKIAKMDNEIRSLKNDINELMLKK